MVSGVTAWVTWFSGIHPWAPCSTSAQHASEPHYYVCCTRGNDSQVHGCPQSELKLPAVYLACVISCAADGFSGLDVASLEHPERECKVGERQGGSDRADSVVTSLGLSFCVLGRRGLLVCTPGSSHRARVTTHLALIMVAVQRDFHMYKHFTPDKLSQIEGWSPSSLKLMRPPHNG